MERWELYEKHSFGKYITLFPPMCVCVFYMVALMKRESIGTWFTIVDNFPSYPQCIYKREVVSQLEKHKYGQTTRGQTTSLERLKV